MNDSPLAPELESLLSQPVARTRRGQFWEGVVAPWQGLKLLNRRRALWRYAVWPIVANVVITAMVLATLLFTVGWALGVVHRWFANSDSSLPAWVGIAAEVFVGVVLLLACVGGALLLWKLLSGVLCGYFYGVLARHVELELGAAPEELGELSLGYQLIDTLYDLAALAAVHAAFFAIGMIPLVGAPLAIAGDFSFTWFIFGADFFDFPLALRGMRRHEKRRFCREHLPHALGLGAVTFVMQFIPLVGALSLTTAVAGTVLLHRRLQHGTD